MNKELIEKTSSTKTTAIFSKDNKKTQLNIRTFCTITE